MDSWGKREIKWSYHGWTCQSILAPFWQWRSTTAFENRYALCVLNAIHWGIIQNWTSRCTSLPTPPSLHAIAPPPSLRNGYDVLVWRSRLALAKLLPMRARPFADRSILLRLQSRWVTWSRRLRQKEGFGIGFGINYSLWTLSFVSGQDMSSSQQSIYYYNHGNH
jgi:hypothetical protein